MRRLAITACFVGGFGLAFTIIGGILYVAGAEITALAQEMRADNKYEAIINRKLAPLYALIDQIESLALMVIGLAWLAVASRRRPVFA